MKWFEILIMIGAILLVVIPFVNAFRKAITKKGACSCGCSDCKKKDSCLANFKAYIKEHES